jgi:hypothetical protein
MELNRKIVCGVLFGAALSFASLPTTSQAWYDSILTTALSRLSRTDGVVSVHMTAEFERAVDTNNTTIVDLSDVAEGRIKRPLHPDPGTPGPHCSNKWGTCVAFAVPGQPLPDDEEEPFAMILTEEAMDYLEEDLRELGL